MTLEKIGGSKEDFLKEMEKYKIPEDVLRDIWRIRTTDPRDLGSERHIFPKYIDESSLTPDERELAYIAGMFQLPGIKTFSTQNPDIDGLKKRARDLIGVVGPERTEEVVHPQIVKFIKEG